MPRHVRFLQLNTVAVYLGLVLLLASSNPAHGRNKEPTYVAIGLHNPTLTIDMENIGTADDAGTGESVIHYQPKDPLVVSIGGSYAGFSASVSFDIPEDTGEHLDYTDYWFSYYFASFGFDAQYTEFERFILSEVENLEYDALEERETRRPDLVVDAISVTGYWFPLRLNWHFEDAFDPAAEDKTTGLGLGVAGSYNSSAFDGDRGLVPPAYGPDYGGEGRINHGQFDALNGQIAVAGTLALWRFYASAMLAVGQGYQWLEYETPRGVVEDVGASDVLTMYARAGYSGKRYFLTGAYRVDTPSFLLEHVTLTPSRSEIYVKFGVKF